MLFLLRQHSLLDDGDCLLLFNRICLSKFEVMLFFLCTIGVFDVGVRMLLRFIFGLVVAEDDTGMVIGRHGKIAKAIRQIMKAAANTCGKHVTVEIK